MRVISGGVDYVGGVERGIRFGFQEILGVEVDIDLAGNDAIARQVSVSRMPGAILLGSRSLLRGSTVHTMRMELIASGHFSRGDARSPVVVIPTGHQLKSSRQALECFNPSRRR
jgi:hypothetical protein